LLFIILSSAEKESRERSKTNDKNHSPDAIASLIGVLLRYLNVRPEEHNHLL
jgi:hypothetical protein